MPPLGARRFHGIREKSWSLFKGKLQGEVRHRRPAHAPAKRMIPGLRYTEVRPGLAVADCPYQPHGWPHPYRFVVVRKTLPEEESPQTTLFTVGRYSYHAFVTNLRIWPLAVYRLYNDRAAVELIIKELKADYPLAKIPTGPVCGQRGVLPSLAVRLQPDELVQAPLSASRVSFDDLGHTTPSPAHDSRGVRPCSPRPDPQLPSLASEQELIKHALNRIDGLKLKI